MKFLEFYESSKIQMWKDFYINFKLISRILKPLQELYKVKLRGLYLKKMRQQPNLQEGDNNNINNNYGNIENDYYKMDEPDVDIQKINDKFSNQLLIELKKVEEFFNETMSKRIEKRLESIQEQFQYLKNHDYFKKFELTFELALRELYKETTLLKSFVDVNMKAKNKLLKKYRKKIKLINIDAVRVQRKDKIDIIVNDYLKDTNLKNYEEKFESIFLQITKLFSFAYSNKYKDQIHKVLKSNDITEEFSQSRSFELGLGVGIVIFEAIVICCTIFNYRRTLFNDDYLYLNVPNFRGFALITLYTLLLGVNIYIWTKKNLTYKILLKIRYPESETFDLFMNSNLFFVMFFTVFMFYMFNKVQMPFLFGVNDIIPNFVYPLFFWGFYLIYFLWPFRCLFNYEGRFYIFNNLIDTIKMKTAFKNIFISEQLITLIPIFRDFGYTICYYIHIFDSNQLVEAHCGYSTFQTKYMLITVIPLILRIIQITIIIRKSNYSTINVGLVHILNLVKNSLFLIASLLSYFAFRIRFRRHILWFWLGNTIIGILFSFWYDLKYDFGLLTTNSFPLRLKIYFNKYTYYYSIVFNFLFRVSFFLLISPEVFVYLGYKFNWLMLLFSVMEIFRRFLWNLFRIELKHIEVAKKFQLTNDVKLPLNKLENGSFILKKEYYSIYNRQRMEEYNEQLDNANEEEEDKKDNGINNAYDPISLLDEYQPEYEGKERVLYDSRVIDDIEDFEKNYDIFDTIYETTLINYLKQIYYKETKKNLQGDLDNLGDISIIDPEFIYEKEQ